MPSPSLDYPIGTRLVVRSRIEGGFTDALGFLRESGAESCTIETRRGLVTVPLEAIVAVKQVPPAPPPRPRRVGHGE